MNFQEINSQAQTVNLDDLYMTSGLNLDLLMTVDSEIETGDLVSYTDDNGAFQLGFYQTLWAYEHAGETSPFFGDNRMMAFVLKLEGGSDYADILSIEKLASVNELVTVKC